MYLLDSDSIIVFNLHLRRLVFNGIPSSCFPSSTGLGSSFDIGLALKVGQALGDECRAKGASYQILGAINVILHCDIAQAPTFCLRLR